MLLISLLWIINSCKKSEQGAPGRLALLPATILASDSSMDWAARAIPLVLAQQLATSSTQFPVLALDQSASYGLNAKAVLRTSLETRNNHLIVKASKIGLDRQLVEQTFEVGGPASEGLLGILDRLARQLDAKAAPLGTSNQKAVMAYAEASLFTQPQQRNDALNKAVSLDPSFGAAQAVLIEGMAKTPEARVLLERARPFVEKFTTLDRARFDALSCQITGRPLPETRKALETLHRLSPGDLQVILQLASVHARLGDAGKSSDMLRAGLQLEPWNLEIRRRLAETRADAGEAQKALDVYRDLLAQKPGDLTTLSSLGQLQFGLGRFSEAEATFETVAKRGDPAALLALAACRLLQGDPTGGDRQIEKYTAIREKAKDPIVPLVQANWRYLKGERKEAATFLEQNLAPQPDVRAIQLSQLSIWHSAARELEKAAPSAAQAAQSASSPVARAFAAIASFVAQQGENPVESLQKVQSWPNLDERSKELALAYALFFRQHYTESAKVWQAILGTDGQTYDARSRIMLASCLLHEGKPKESAHLASRMPVPNVSGADLFSFLTLQESLRVKAATADQAGQGSAAKQYRALWERVTK